MLGSEAECRCGSRVVTWPGVMLVIGGFFWICLFFLYLPLSLSMYLSSAYKVMIRQRADVAPGL